MSMRFWICLGLVSWLQADCHAGFGGTNALPRYVTNWVTAPAHYRVVSNVAQDINISPPWRLVSIPANTTCQATYRGKGRIEPLTVDFAAGTVHYRVHNFPYNPRLFVRDPRMLGMTEGAVNASPLSFRAMFLRGETNYAPRGGRITSIFLEFDHGLPCTNKIPVIRKLP